MSKKIITVDLNFPTETSTVNEIINEPVDEYAAVKEEAAIEPPPALTIAKPKRKPAPKKVKQVVEEPVIEAIEEPIEEAIEEPIAELLNQ